MNSRSNNRGHRQHQAPTLDFVHVLLSMKAMRRTRDRCAPAPWPPDRVLCLGPLGIGRAPVQNLLLDVPVNNLLVELLDESDIKFGFYRP